MDSGEPSLSQALSLLSAPCRRVRRGILGTTSKANPCGFVLANSLSSLRAVPAGTAWNSQNDLPSLSATDSFLANSLSSLRVVPAGTAWNFQDSAIDRLRPRPDRTLSLLSASCRRVRRGISGRLAGHHCLCSHDYALPRPQASGNRLNLVTF